MSTATKGSKKCPAAVADREPCRYAPAPDATYCRLHESPTSGARPVNRLKWCRVTARRSTEPFCQRPVLVGSDFCEKHDPAVKADRQEREARAVLLMTLGGTPGALLALLVVYNWDENTIYIESAFYGRPSEALCVEVLELFKDTISPDWRKPGGSTGLPANLLGVFFDHVNATSKKRPTDLDENLFRVFVASVGLSETPTEQTVGGLKFVHSKNSIYCKSRIPDPTPTFTKFGTVPQK